MVIVLVVAATLLFSGGLTGNVPREAFSSVTPRLDREGVIECVPDKEGKVLAGQDAVIVRINEDCSEDIVADCVDSSRPFITVRTAYGVEEVQCRGLGLSTAGDRFPSV